MRPILLKGHERPLTYLKFNAEGDLLFSCAKDNHPTLWYAGDGERIGTYKGHNGTVWTCDVTSDSEKLLTASGTSRETNVSREHRRSLRLCAPDFLLTVVIATTWWPVSIACAAEAKPRVHNFFREKERESVCVCVVSA